MLRAPRAWRSQALQRKCPVPSQFKSISARAIRPVFSDKATFRRKPRQKSEDAFGPDPPGRKAMSEWCVSTRLGQRPNADPPCDMTRIAGMSSCSFFFGKSKVPRSSLVSLLYRRFQLRDHLLEVLALPQRVEVVVLLHRPIPGGTRDGWGSRRRVV